MRVRFPLPAPFYMNVCHELKTILWLPPRTGSRTVASLFSKYNFINTYTQRHINKVEYVHELGIPVGCEDYEIICSVRNPYSWLLSIWAWNNFYPDVAEKDRISFSTFIEKDQYELTDISKNILNAKITYPIRLESLREDLINIPWFELTEDELEMCVNTNSNNSPELKRTKNNNLLTDYYSYYSKKEFQIVKTKFLPLFKKFGYIITALSALFYLNASLNTA